MNLLRVVIRYRDDPFSLVSQRFCLSTTKTPQTVTLQVTILCQQISKKKQHAPEHSFALTLRRSFVTIFWQKNLTKLQLAVLPFAVFCLLRTPSENPSQNPFLL